MADIEKKLADFSNIILSEAQQQKEQIVSELEKSKKLAVQEKEIELLKDAYEKIQKAVSKYSKEQNEHILKQEMDAKKHVLKKREEIIDEVFSEIENRLKAFTLSPEYKDWLISLAKKACGEVGLGKITICERDLTFKDDITAALPGVEITACKDDIIGGLAARYKNLSVNYTIKEMLSDKRSEFLKTSGLSIKA